MKMAALALSLAIASLLASPTMAKTATSEMSDAEFYQYVVDFSGKPDWQDPRAALSGGYVTPLGLQIHPICFDYYEQDHRDRSLDSKKIDASVRETAEKLISCAERHPELAEAYLKPALQHLQRTVVTCSNELKHPLGSFRAAATNVTLQAGASLVLKEDELTGIDFFTGEDALRSMPEAFRTTIVISNIYGFPNIPASTLLHELLHSTGANNFGTGGHTSRYDARTGLEGAYADPKATNACSLWHYSDRISFIEDLCTSSKIPESVFNEVSGCGQRRCTDVFTQSHVSWLEKTYMPSENLTKKQATSLCSRLYREGKRQASAADLFSARQLNDSKLGKIRAKMRLARDGLMPLHLGLSHKYINVIELNPHVEFLRNNRCFKRIFIETKLGFASRDRWKKNTSPSSSIFRSFQNYFDALVERLNGLDADKTMDQYCDSESWSQVKNLIYEATNRSRLIDFSSAIDIALRFIDRGHLDIDRVENLVEAAAHLKKRKDSGPTISTREHLVLNFASELARHYADHYVKLDP